MATTTKLGRDPTEIRIGMIGSVNAGKSTLVGVLTSGRLDNGGGSARMSVLRHKHEKEKGQTSSIATQYIEFPDENKYYTFVDMAGHERYLKTTVHGLVGLDIDYVLVMVGTSMGITRMTKEHISTAFSLRIPVIVIFTKIDICPKDLLKKTVSDVKDIFKHKHNVRGAQFYGIKNEKSMNAILDQFQMGASICPYFFVSNKTGEGLDLLRNFLFSLPTRHNWDKHKEKKLMFKITEAFNVTGVGKVVSGKVIRGKIMAGQKILVGPFGGQWYKMIAKSLHDNFRRNIDELTTGQSGCIAFRPRDKKYEIRDKKLIMKGMVVVSEDVSDPVKMFKADVMVLTHQTTITKGYQPIINIGTVVQSAKIMDIDKDRDVLRSDDIASVTFQFMYRPELIHPGQAFMFREGETRGVGKVISVV
jgi:GTPase